ncbi:hypothetical protein ACS0TY_000958 [Phlomoides rotata]
MANSEKRQCTDDRRVDTVDQDSDGEESVDVSFSGPATSANSFISRRLTAIFLEGGDEDLLLQRSDRENGVLQWLRALDLQVMGACRADERLKPLLKLNASSGEVEDHLLAQLGEHFEPSEIGLLARCLCVPLVSIRVGKISKQGTLLSPTSVRGNLCLTLLPTSDLRISFNGDDGSVERLATLTSEAHCTAINIEEISADNSCRSFLIKTMDGVVHYFWCSEKSQLLGNELLRKMKIWLITRPLLGELTGISEGRLNSFATHLRAYLSGSTVDAGGVLSASIPSDNDSFDSSEIHFPQSSFTCENNSFFPRSSSKDGPPESLSSGKIANEDNVLCADRFSFASTNSGDPSNSTFFPETNGIYPLAALDFLEAFGKPSQLPLSIPNIQVPSSFSPHYCLCPLVNSQLPIPKTESLRLPPLSSLLSKSSLNLVEVPPLDFPSFLPDSLFRLPTSQQIPTFSPMMCDPIIHIPVINVCTSGPGYLVSAGTTISHLNPNLMDPLLLNGESVVEKSARETLRLLISGNNQPNPQLLEVVLPSVLNKQNVAAAATSDDSIDEKEKLFYFGSSRFDAGME